MEALKEEIEILPAKSTADSDTQSSIEKGSFSDTTQHDPFLVEFNKHFDPGNPKDWSLRKKWMVTIMLSSTGFNRIMVSTIMAPALETIKNEFHQSSIESSMSLSVYLLATAFGPLFIGPLSEVYGRLPIFHASSAFFLVWNLICGFSNGSGLLITARLFAGLGASSIFALGGGVLGDLWTPEERGHSLGLYSLIPLLAPAVGPIIGGYITEYTTWRWMYWSTSIAQAVLMVLGFLAFRETYRPIILQRRARQLRKSSGNDLYHTATERMSQNRTTLSLLAHSLTRPFRLLAFHPIIQVVALISAFSYGILYLVISTYSDLWINRYNRSLSFSGLQYLAIALGEIFGAQIGGPLMDYSYRKLKGPQTEPSTSDDNKKKSTSVPEYRIPLSLPSIIIAAAGMFIYGWTAEFKVYWFAIDVGVFVTTFGWQIVGMCMTAYVIDSYPEHVGSATAASRFLSSLAAFAFPLFAPDMYASIGYGWGNTMMGLITFGMGVPALGLVWVWGERLRGRALSSW